MAADNKHKVTIKGTRASTEDMVVGEIAVVTTAGAYKGKVMAKSLGGLIILSDLEINITPDQVFAVDILPKGTVLEIEV